MIPSLRKYLGESLSDEDKKKIQEVGEATAKAIFKDKYDQATVDKLVADVIEKNADLDADHIAAIVKHSFRADAQE